MSVLNPTELDRWKCFTDEDAEAQSGYMTYPET